MMGSAVGTQSQAAVVVLVLSCLAVAMAQNSTSNIVFCGHSASDADCRPVDSGGFFLAVGPFVLIPYLACCALASYGCYHENKTEMDGAAAWARSLAGGDNSTTTSSRRTPTTSASSAAGTSTAVNVRPAAEVEMTSTPGADLDSSGSIGGSIRSMASLPEPAAAAGGGSAPMSGGGTGGAATGLYRVATTGDHLEGEKGDFSLVNMVMWVGPQDDMDAEPYFLSGDKTLTVLSQTSAAYAVAMVKPNPTSEPCDLHFNLLQRGAEDSLLLLVPQSKIERMFDNMGAGSAACGQVSCMDVAKALFDYEDDGAFLAWAQTGDMRVGSRTGPQHVSGKSRDRQWKMGKPNGMLLDMGGRRHVVNGGDVRASFSTGIMAKRYAWVFLLSPGTKISIVSDPDELAQQREARADFNRELSRRLE